MVADYVTMITHMMFMYHIMSVFQKECLIFSVIFKIIFIKLTISFQITKRFLLSLEGMHLHHLLKAKIVAEIIVHHVMVSIVVVIIINMLLFRFGWEKRPNVLLEEAENKADPQE